MSTRKKFINNIYDMYKLSANIKVIILSFFILAVGSSMVRPFMTVYLKEDLAIDLKLIGLALAFNSIIQFSGSLITGYLCDRLNLKNIYIVGVFIRILSYVSLFVFAGSSIAVLSLTFMALGAMFFSPPQRMMLSLLGADNNEKTRYFGYNSALLNIGLATGPLLGSLFFNSYGYTALYVFSCISATVVFAMYFIWIKPIDLPKPQIAETQAKWSIKSVKISRAGLGIFINQLFFSFLTIGFYQYLSIYASSINLLHLVGILFTSYYITIALLQSTMHRFIALTSVINQTIYSYGTIFVGLLLIFSANMYGLILGSLIMGIGNGSLTLKQESLSLQEKSVGTSFGMYRLFHGMGMALGSFVHASAYAYIENAGYSTSMYWAYLIAAGALCLIAGLVALRLTIRE